MQHGYSLLSGSLVLPSEINIKCGLLFNDDTVKPANGKNKEGIIKNNGLCGV